MKKILAYIPDWILVPLIGIFTLATWPVILIYTFFHTIFSKNLNDGQKVEILKEISLLFLLLGIMFVIYSFSPEEV
jgi:hypothetical protein